MMDWARALEEGLQAAVPAPEGPLEPFYGMVAYHMGWRDPQLRPARAPAGKRIRPRLCLWSCAAVGGDPARALPAAVALELLHNFTLVHDDIQDRSPTRRHRPAVWALWGEAQGINVGDALFTLAQLALLRTEGEPALVLELVRRFNQVTLQICEGQYLDLAHEGDVDWTVEGYLEMIRRKTGVLIELACELGARIGGGTGAQVAALGRYGRALGRAFQLRDDLRGIWLPSEETGKPQAEDLYARKMTLPILRLLERLPAADPDGARVRALYRREAPPDDGEVAWLLGLLEREGIREGVEEEVRRAFQEALEALEALPASEAREELEGLVQALWI